MSAIWVIIGDAIKRDGKVIAEISRERDGKFMWEGMNMRRIGFKTKKECKEDVKWFHLNAIRRQTVIKVQRMF